MIKILFLLSVGLTWSMGETFLPFYNEPILRQIPKSENGGVLRIVKIEKYGENQIKLTLTGKTVDIFVLISFENFTFFGIGETPFNLFKIKSGNLFWISGNGILSFVPCQTLLNSPKENYGTN